MAGLEGSSLGSLERGVIIKGYQFTNIATIKFNKSK